MRKIDVERTVQILANVGVIAGIAFLVAEVHQNNQLLAAEAGQRFVQQRTETLARWADDAGDMMSLRLKATKGAPLTQEEQWRLESDTGMIFSQLEWEFQQYQAGRISYLPLEAYKAITARWPYLEQLWQTGLRSRYTANFAQFMDGQFDAASEETR
jgi:hypothetical protein